MVAQPKVNEYAASPGEGRTRIVVGAWSAMSVAAGSTTLGLDAKLTVSPATMRYGRQAASGAGLRA
jgi:hypothetical protein